jgi:hypothetical protein
MFRMIVQLIVHLFKSQVYKTALSHFKIVYG